MAIFGARNAKQRSAAIRSIKAIARVLFEAGDDDAIVVNELQCTEPGCPPIETVVALLRAGSEPRQLKLHKPASEVTEGDLRAAMHGHDEHDHGQHDAARDQARRSKLPDRG